MGRLARASGSSTTLVGAQPDACLRYLIRESLAFVGWAVEDFGLAAAEALCEGVPCVLPREGGGPELLELAGARGSLFETGSHEDFARALERALLGGRATPGQVEQVRRHLAPERFVARVRTAMG